MIQVPHRPGDEGRAHDSLRGYAFGPPPASSSSDEGACAPCAAGGTDPERQRQVIYLRYRADLAYEEIGQALGITAGAARLHAAHAIERLRVALAGTIEDVT